MSSAQKIAAASWRGCGIASAPGKTQNVTLLAVMKGVELNV
jgi:hypothetical protein